MLEATRMQAIKFGRAASNYEGVIIQRADDECPHYIVRPTNCGECIYQHCHTCPKKCILHRKRLTEETIYTDDEL